ncbi:MAG: galactokinase [Acidobacteria bacterium]|nr:galactokinase [Acidobacteriota bacterium]
MNKTRARVLDAFRRRFGGEPAWLVRAPGRVNLLGAHIDYSEGWVLPGAIDRSIWLALRPAEAPSSTIEALDRRAEGAHLADITGVSDIVDIATLDTARLPPPVPERGGEADGTWQDLPRGVAWTLARAGHHLAPIDAVFGGDLPMDAGVSSSAAVEVAFLMAWEAASGFSLDGVERARLGRRVENDYLGVGSGIMDQFASIHGKTGHLMLLDCRDLAFERIPLPDNVAVVIADSGIRRTLASSDYNRRPEECRQAVDLLRRALPEIRTLRDVTEEDLDRHARVMLPSSLERRARHAVCECRRVLDGAEALRNGSLRRFGELMRESHESSRDLYQVSLPELDALASTAWSAPGCFGARLSGAGWGGCVTALVEEAAAEDVERRLRREFARAFGHECETFVAAFGDGAAIVDIGDSVDIADI